MLLVVIISCYVSFKTLHHSSFMSSILSFHLATCKQTLWSQNLKWTIPDCQIRELSNLSTLVCSSFSPLHSQIQPVLWAKDIEPHEAPSWRPLSGCGQQPEEEGSPAPKFQSQAWLRLVSLQTKLCPRRGANPTSGAQPGRSTDGERAGLLLPQGN